jgi:hypothetical protein
MLKLLDAAEKAKKTLSPVGVVDALINLVSVCVHAGYMFMHAALLDSQLMQSVWC